MTEPRTGTPRWTTWALAGVVVLAIASRLGATWYLWDPDRTAMEYGNIAGHLVQGRGFAISLNHWGWYNPPAMTTRWMMPFYPVLLAGSKLLTPERPRWYLDAYVLQSLLAGGIAWGLYRLGSRLYGAGAGLLSAAIFCLVPSFAYYAARPHPLYWELAALLLALMACRAYVAGGKRRHLVGCALAVLWAIYVRSAGVLLVPLMIALIVLVTRDWRRAVRASVLLVLIVALGVAPWAIRNYARFGSPGLTCLDFPFWEGHNSLGQPTGYGTYGENISNVREFHPEEWAALNAVRDDGEQAIMGVFRDAAWAEIRRRPRLHLLELPATRAWYFLSWDPNHPSTLDWKLYRWPYLVLAGTAAAGLVLTCLSRALAPGSRGFALTSVLGVWAAGSLTVAVFHYLPRFRMPAELMLMLPAGYFLARVAAALTGRRGAPPPASS